MDVAKRLGATDFGKSQAQGKRFYVIYNGKKINFGSTSNNTFIDHHDALIQKNWRARHSKIKLKNGDYAYTVKTQPEYWSWHILWT